MTERLHNATPGGVGCARVAVVGLLIERGNAERSIQQQTSRPPGYQDDTGQRRSHVIPMLLRCGAACLNLGSTDCDLRVRPAALLKASMSDNDWTAAVATEWPQHVLDTQLAACANQLAADATAK